MRKYTLFLLLFVIIGADLKAQDKHFTQFYAAPLTLNPALSGAFNGRYRFSAIYRDQWRNVLENPFTTFAGALDLRFPIQNFNSRSTDAAGVGLLFYNDKVPEFDFSTTQIAVSGAFHKSLNVQNNQYLSLGAQLGLTQRNVNYTDLVFSDQFNGADGYGGSTVENLPRNNFSYADLAVGLNYTYAPDKGTGIYLGAALHHILQPQVSFYFDEEEPEESISNKLHRKITGHLGLQIPLGDQVQLLPRAVVNIQGPHLEINAGSNVRFRLGEFGSTALHLGGWARPVQNEQEDLNLAAVIVMTGIEYNNVLLGFSYDASFSDLQANQFGRSAFEVSIAYLGNYIDDTLLCPKF